MRAAGRKTGRSTPRRRTVARPRRRRRLGRPDRAEQLDAVAKARSFTSWLMVTGRITVDAELLSRTDLRPGIPPAGSAPPTTTGSPKHVPGSAFPAGIPRRSGTSGEDHRDHRCVTVRGHRRTLRRRPRRDDHRLRPPRQTHRGQERGRGLPPLAADPLPRRPAQHAAPAVGEPARVGDRMGNGSTGIRRVRAPLRRAGHGESATEHGQDHRARPARFGTWLADTHPEVDGCADLRREHIEAFKTWLCTHPTPVPANRSTASASRTR